MYKEFKEFVMRGNVVDLAIGVIIGAAFGRIVTSFVEDILMPPIGVLLGNVDFSNLFINLSGKDYPSVAAAKAAGAATLNYGIFINNVINFLIIAFVIFLLVKQINRMQRPAAEAAPQAVVHKPERRDDKRPHQGKDRGERGRDTSHQRRGPQGDRHRRDDRRKDDRRKAEVHTAAPPRRGGIDPDSPFAALGALRDELAKRGKETST